MAREPNDGGPMKNNGFLYCKGETCPMSSTCYRSPMSGWEIEGEEEWFIEEPYWRIPSTTITLCDYYWKKFDVKKQADTGTTDKDS
jgi:hypothetical protein